MNYYGTGTIEYCLTRDPREYVTECEHNYDLKLITAAQEILLRSEDCPIILLSGPSGSGKTTTALRIESLLDGWGHEAHTVSMDNYFHRPADWVPPLDEKGEVDYESPLCLDIPLMAEHLEKLACCVPVEVPSFDFEKQQRTDKTTRLERKKGELIIVEGIHSLNPQVTGSAQRFSTGVYVSVRTRVVSRGGLILPPEKLRLLRRLIRDQNYRGQDYASTIKRFASVTRGEGLYIMPYKQQAEIQIDTFLPYEVALLGGMAREGIRQLPPDFLRETGVDVLLSVIDELSASPPEKDVPNASLVREFIGGSSLGY